MPQYTVASVIGEPESILFTEALKAGPLLVVVMGQEVTRGLDQKRPLTLFHFFKAHVSSMPREPGDAVRTKPSYFYQLLQADEQRITGEGGKGRVG